jgi:hypothetical protein
VSCGVSIKDIGGSGTDTTSIEYAISIHGTLNYGSWTKVESDQMKVSKSGTEELIDITVDPSFINGTDNYIKWRATDNAGNGDKDGYFESDDIQIKIDVTLIENFAPIIVMDLPKDNFTFEAIESIIFSGLDSYDPDGDDITFRWSSNVTGSLSTDPWFQTELEPGTHEIILEVEDSYGHRATRAVTITIEQPLKTDEMDPTEGLVFGLAPASATTYTATFILIATLLFFGGTEIGKYKLLGFLIPLYSKLTKKMVLDHETRGMIRGYIIANPGDHFTSIKKQIGLKNGTLAYHLKILERENIIKSQRDGIFKRFYPINVKISSNMVHMSKQEIILNTVIENPGVSRKELANIVGLSRQVVNYH